MQHFLADNYRSLEVCQVSSMGERKFAVLAQTGQRTAQWDIFAPDNQDSGPQVIIEIRIL